MIFLNILGHLHTINTHKRIVMKYCFKAGLYKQGLLHDLSKYSPIEFFSGAKYYQGYRSPNSAEREAIGYSAAWLHHKGRNKHHYEYWIDFGPDSSKGLQGMPMPDRYIVEMFIDRMAACKTYYGENYKDSSPLEYYEKNKSHYIMHPHTVQLLEGLLNMLATKGEEKTIKYIKNIRYNN